MLKFNKSTMLALYGMLELAKAGDEPLAVSEIADRYGVSRHHLAKVLRELVRRGFLHTTRGVRGGHRLARDPKNVTLMDIVEVFEGPRTPPDACLIESIVPGCTRQGACGIQAIFRELDEQVSFTLDSVTLKTLLRTQTKPS